MSKVLGLSDWISIILFIIGTTITYLQYSNIRRRKIIFIVNDFLKPAVEINDHSWGEYFISGTIIYDGNTDLQKSEISFPISLDIHSEDVEWEEYCIISKSKNLDCELRHSQNVLIFATGDLISGDYITFKAHFKAKEITWKSFAFISFDERCYNLHHRILNSKRKVMTFKKKDIDGLLFISYIYMIIIAFFTIVMYDFLFGDSPIRPGMLKIIYAMYFSAILLTINSLYYYIITKNLSSINTQL